MAVYTKSKSYAPPNIWAYWQALEPLKAGVWLFFFLLIFDGALRKWVLPQLATPLLVINSPVAIWLLYRAFQKGVVKVNGYIFAIWATGAISFVATILVGHHHVLVAAYGLRILWIFFPLMFVIGQVFTKEDVIKLGEVILYISLPMLLVVAWQFFTPDSAWISRGIGGTGTASFPGALGYGRPSGTFSFNLGNALFWSLVVPFIFYFWLSPDNINRVLLWAATGALLIAIPISVSRRLFFHVAITVLFVLIILQRNPKYLGHFLLAAAGVGILFILLSNTYIVKKALQVFIARFTSASGSEGTIHGTLIHRFLGRLVRPFINSADNPFWGYGLGMGTNAGAKLLTGHRGFMIAEGEWGRIIGEMGLFLGSIVILTRLAFVIQLGWKSLKKIKSGTILPWLLFSVAGITVLTSQWPQPTVLGFSTLLGGLVLASLREPKQGNAFSK